MGDQQDNAASPRATAPSEASGSAPGSSAPGSSAPGMNPSDEIPKSAVNGQTTTINPPPSAALRGRQRPKKG